MIMKSSNSALKYFLFSILLIAIDQISKLLVHYNMEPGFAGQIVLIGDWLKLHYVLNPGMAFGMQLGHENGKLILTLFRLVAMVGIGWYIVKLHQTNASKGLIWAMSMIFAGAVGNVIDSTFYGVWLGNAPYGSSTPWFHGQVVDMIFVDFWEGFLPEWIPIWGGQYYSTPIFNFADSCIFVGVCIILIFQGSFFHEGVYEGTSTTVATSIETNNAAPKQETALSGDTIEKQSNNSKDEVKES